jgi:AraC family transcriptional regulator, positive regulator of tynA and feaB
MDKVIAMSDIHPRDRVSYWLDVASRALVDHECRVKTPCEFDATVLRAPLGELSVMSVESLGLESVEHTASTSHGEDNVFLLYVQLTGSSTFSQDGRETVIHPGDLVLLDAQRPFVCRYDYRKQIAIKIPHRVLKARLPSSSRLTAHAVRHAAGGAGPFTSDYIRLIPSHVEALPPAAKLQVAEHVLDLAALALSTMANETPSLSSGRAVALLRLRMAIESHLTEPKLNPQAAAAAAGISVRYANELLSQQGMSLERFIVARRLERCRLALEDPQQGTRTISEIAFAWGFSDMSHFNRRFKASFGCSPTDYRRQRQR